MQNTLRRFGKNLKNARLKKHLSISELSNKSEIDSSTISKYENGKLSNLNMKKIYKLAKLLDADIALDIITKNEILREVEIARIKDLGIKRAICSLIKAAC